MPNRAGGPTTSEMARDRNMAVVREQNALSARGIMGVPNFASRGPVATISRGFSSDLVSKSNPLGEAIINSIDEPMGMASLGFKSKRNFAGGFIPNFAKGADDLIGKYSKGVANFLFGEFANVKPGESPYDIYDPKKIIGGEFQKVFDAYAQAFPKSKKELDALRMADPNFDNFRKAVDAELASAGEKAPRLVLPTKIEAETPKPVRQAPKAQAKPAGEAQKLADALKQSGAMAKLLRAKPATAPAPAPIPTPAPAPAPIPEIKATPAPVSIPEVKAEIKKKSTASSKSKRKASPKSISPLEVEGQYLLRLAIPADPKTGRASPSIKTFVERTIQKQREQQSLEDFKNQQQPRAIRGPTGQFPLFEQEREGGSLFGKGTGTYGPAKGLRYLSIGQAEKNKLAEESKRVLEAQARSEKLLNDYAKRKLVPSEEVLAARRKAIFGQTPEEQAKMERGLFEQQYRELERKEAADKAAFERDYKRLEQQEAAAKKREGKPLTGRRATREYDRNQSNLRTSSLLKNIILQSGLEAGSVKAITGLSPDQFGKLRPSQLEALMAERGINVDSRGTGLPGGGLLVKDYLLDLSNSKLSEAEADTVRQDILKKAAGGNLDNLSLTQSSKPEALKPNFQFGAGIGQRQDGLFGPKRSFLGAIKELRNKNALNLKGVFGQGLSGVLGYKSQISIDRSAAKLLNLEKSLSSSGYPEEIKNNLRQDFLKKEGSFADRVLARSNELASKKDRANLIKSLEFGVNNVGGKNSSYSVLTSIMRNMKQAVEAGKITPQDAAREYFKLAGKKGVTDQTLISMSQSKGLRHLSVSNEIISEFSKAPSTTPSLREAIYESQLQRDKELVSKKIRMAGIEQEFQVGDKVVKKIVPFEQVRLQAIREVMRNPSLSAS